ncbi:MULTISPECIES: AAA family ATPase [unclassified Chamaesiphon]|uniref:AAA family ATPase n=1 Tax=unclassified Chamaesiphon TaxID=2620921 RepID=UPI00286BF4A1|nr:MULTISPECIES: AAA family ATPase [unclassified Chamaesiphon]
MLDSVGVLAFTEFLSKDMQIKSIKIDNFKSLVNFELPLAKFSCLVGLNGSGKSTVLQFLDFLSQQVRGDLSGWLKQRQWESSDLSSKLTRKKNINFEVLLIHSENFEIIWHGSFNRTTLQCTNESIEWDEYQILEVADRNYNILTICEIDDSPRIIGYVQESVIAGRITSNYQGSVISQIKESELPKELYEFKKFFANLHALDLLAPELLRQRTRDAGNSLGLGGEKLSAFLHEIGEAKRDIIQAKLAKVYPQFKHLDILSLRSGWKSLTIQEQFGDTIVKTEARHVAD